MDGRGDERSIADDRDIGIRTLADKSAAMQDRFARAVSIRFKEMQDVSHERNRLDLAESPAQIFRSDGGNFLRRSECVEWFHCGRDRDNSRCQSCGRNMAAGRADTARDLKVDRCVLQRVGRKEISANLRKLLRVESFNARKRKASCESLRV